MLHWLPTPATAFLGARRPGPALPGDPVNHCVEQLRATHALMLAYAAQRRRAAADPADAAYWKAAELHALEKARGIRSRPGFRRLP